MTEGNERRLAAIVSADVVGYSRLMGEDEDGTLARLRAHRSELIDPMIGQHGGRIVKTMGDGLLLEFAEATAAVRCALAIQEGMAARNEGMPEERRIVFRIGINLSEVVVEDGDIFGDGVNLTARLEAMAEPGGLLVSEALHDAVGDGLEVAFADSGKRTFKNIANPVRVWSWPRPLPETRENRKPFVAVAKFDGGREEERRLAEDLRDDLTAALARLTGLEVTLDRRKADYLIQGGVRLAGGRSRISAQLIRVEDDDVRSLCHVHSVLLRGLRSVAAQAFYPHRGHYVNGCEQEGVKKGIVPTEGARKSRPYRKQPHKIVGAAFVVAHSSTPS